MWLFVWEHSKACQFLKGLQLNSSSAPWCIVPLPLKILFTIKCQVKIKEGSCKKRPKGVMLIFICLDLSQSYLCLTGLGETLWSMFFIQMFKLQKPTIHALDLKKKNISADFIKYSGFCCYCFTCCFVNVRACRYWQM